ncbi:MAG: type II and III secretion system protein family protein [Alphaproteobacteria bacterium]|nr:MAG: type II and III secretion system protein family protein [Alphaproteobacteria bacterium]
MKLRDVILAATLGAAQLLLPGVVSAQSPSVLRIMQGATSNSIVVALNRAVVVESSREFAEVSVANPGIADVAALSNKTVYVLGKAPGRTTLTILGPGGRPITNVDIRVSPDIAEFKERLREVLPGERIEVRTANDGIVLSGKVSGARKIDQALELAERYAPGRVTNLMQVGGTQQVMLKVRIAEMQRSTAKSLGVSLGIRTLFGNFSINGSTNNITLTGTPPTATYTQPTDAFGSVVGSIAAGNALFVDLAIDALESKGMVRTLAEPNLIALSGDQAKFLAGGEVPIPVPNDAGIAIEYKPFGVGLSFRPRVIDEDLINIELEAFVSSIDTANGIVLSTVGGNVLAPAFTVRRANTTVELRDGQSFAIAGLLQDAFTDNASQLPWLGDLPVLGTLFRSTDFQRSQSELVIIVTPYLVVPTDEESIALPTDRIRIPNERELFLLGKVEGTPTVRDVAQQDFEGKYGYVSE